jgi:hypothetical protein
MFHDHYSIHFDMEPRTSLERLVLTYPERPWNWHSLPGNPEIRPEYVIAHPELPWNTEWAIYVNPRLTPEWLKEHPDFPIDWNGYSGNPSLTRKFLIDNLDKEWNWIRLSSNMAITEVIVEELIDDPRARWNWGYSGLSKNPNISYEFVEKHFDKPWNFRLLSMNNQGLNRCVLGSDTEEKSKERIQKRTDRLRRQLMRRTWHPSRVHDWCFDEEEKMEMEI